MGPTVAPTHRDASDHARHRTLEERNAGGRTENGPSGNRRDLGTEISCKRIDHVIE